MALRHRRGWKKRPACNGKLECVYKGTPKPPVEAQAITLPSAPAHNAGGAHNADGAHEVDGTQAPAPAHQVHFTEFHSPIPGEEDPDDPEIIASRLLSQGLGGPFDGGFNGADGSGGNLPPGDWSIETPQQNVGASTDRISVSLPIEIRMYYDLARRDLGWSRGDNSLSAFIADVVEDHFNYCWARALLHVDRKEIEVG